MRVHSLVTYFVHFPQFAITWGIFFGAGLLTFGLQLLRNRNQFSLLEMIRHCIPFDPLTSKSFHMDVLIYALRVLTEFIFMAPGLAIMALTSAGTDALLRDVFGNPAPIHPGYLVTFSCTIVMFLVVEFSDYFMHFLEHKVPVMWELHKVHHSADFLNPLTSKRGHFIPLVYNGVVGGLFAGVTAGFFMALFGLSLPEVLLLKVISSKLFVVVTLDPLKHSHIPISLGWFDRLLISPHMHQIHHSKLKPHWDKNFGTNLSIYDWIFGTRYRPARGEEAVFGISTYSDVSLQKFNTPYGAFINPMLRSWKALRKQFAHGPATGEIALPEPSDTIGKPQ
jgi:sterol desaturase/sphingolipid hydroxylase (fatty acid hydroxylase superfamily)